MHSLESLAWILGLGLTMTAIAVIGGLFVLLPEATLRRLLKPMVAFAAGSLVGGALFHLLPHALAPGVAPGRPLAWVAIGFAIFFALDQLLEWHHCHKPPSEHTRPLGPLLLLADGLHNLLEGLAVGAILLVDLGAGVAAWLAAAIHEVPQEIGDFGALVHAGMPRRRALALNALSGLTFPLGGVIAWLVGDAVDIDVFLALGCGNFLYIAAADLIPEVKRSERLSSVAIRFLAFVAGALLLFALSHRGMHG